MISVRMTPAAPQFARSALITNQKTRWAAALALPAVVGPLWCLAWQSHGGWIGTLAGFVLVSVLVVSAVTDARDRKIYNWATYSAFLWAIAINVTASLLLLAGRATVDTLEPANLVGPQWLGGVGIGQSLAGAALCFIITFFGYRLSGGGAGDVKLAAAIGALLGVHHGVFAVAYSYIIAAVAIIAWSIYKNGPLALVKAASRTIGSFLGPLWPFPPTATDTKLLLQPIPLGPYFALGTLLVALELVPV